MLIPASNRDLPTTDGTMSRKSTIWTNLMLHGSSGASCCLPDWVRFLPSSDAPSPPKFQSSLHIDPLVSATVFTLMSQLRMTHFPNCSNHSCWRRQSRIKSRCPRLSIIQHADQLSQRIQKSNHSSIRNIYPLTRIIPTSSSLSSSSWTGSSSTSILCLHCI